MPRDITVVIDRIVAVIPVDRSTLLGQLRGVRQSATYTPPEHMTIRWGELAHVLSRDLGVPDCDWKRQVAAIMSNTPYGA